MNPAVLLLVLAASLDSRMAAGVRSGWRSPGMDAVMQAATQLGSAPAIVGVNGAVFLAGDEELRHAALASYGAWAGALAVVTVTKFCVNRPRPDDPNPGRLNSAFPSGHTTEYFAAASVYAFRYPAAAPLLGAGGAMVALSRVYLGHHWPSDVVAGALLGTAVGYVAHRLEPRLRLPEWTDRLHIGQAGPEGLDLVAFAF
jgi:undecaprenyl-diphosphatase